MSVPDKDLDEPDLLVCETHLKPYPCCYCRFEAQMQRAEEIREEYSERESQP